MTISEKRVDERLSGVDAYEKKAVIIFWQQQRCLQLLSLSLSLVTDATACQLHASTSFNGA